MNIDLNHDLLAEYVDVEDNSQYDTGERGILDLNADVVGHEEVEQCTELETGTAMSNNTPVAPTVGMVFGSWEDIDEFFCRYGKGQGFGVIRAAGSRRRSKRRNGDGVQGWRNYTWKCECAGEVDQRRLLKGNTITVGRNGVEVSTRKSKKCGCPVMLFASANDEGAWEVRKVNLSHQNHNPTPGKTRYISKYRKEEVNCTVRQKLFNDSAAGVGIAQIHRCLAKERNGLDNMAITERDLRNMVAKERKLKFMEGDANAMMSYFERMTTDNKDFFHMHRLDEFGNLKDVVWIDARSRMAYDYFGDVVCFDATYLTNDYALPFANFVGVNNHHGQSILLGCALVSHEDAETYAWVFSTWLLGMGGKALSCFLTDQDAAMRKAMSLVMANTCHRWCLWHILSKFGKKLVMYARYKEFKTELLDAIYESVSKEEFEMLWNATIEEYELGDEEWLTGISFSNISMVLVLVFKL